MVVPIATTAVGPRIADNGDSRRLSVRKHAMADLDKNGTIFVGKSPSPRC